MVTKGEIQSIDYGGNTCEVRIPYFESAGINDRIIATATIGNQPGMYNGYRAGDVVWIAFEDGEASKPVVIGKLFLGSEAERGDARGVINVESATASSSMTMPINSNLAYEKDASVAQNGETKYGKISDMANKLATITAQQDKTAYDVTGVVSTGSMLKSEMSSIKAGSGSKSTYQSASRPEETVYEKQEDLSSFSEASSYVGYYIQTGVDKDNKPQYEQVTDANKDSLELYPGITTPYKLRKLSDGDIWIYTGPNLYEEDSSAISWAVADPANLTTLDDYYKYYKKDGKKFTDEDTIVLETNSTEKKTVAYYPNLAGYYVYCEKKDESTFWIKNNNPWTRPCPEESCKDSSKNSDAQKYYPTESGDCVFRLAVSANCDPKDGNYIHPIDANTKKYKLHLAKNQSFYWDGKKQTWVKGSDDRFDEYKSAITQTAEKLQSEFSHTNEKMESYNSSITQTAESITLAVSKTVQGQSKTYAQATKPDTYSKLTESVWKAFKTTADYVGLYLDKDGAKTEVTKDNKDSLSITPGTSEAYSKLNANDVWIYTGEDLYIDAQNDTEDKFDYAKATKTSQYVGHYIRSGTPKPNSPCPHCSITNGDTGMFTLVTAKNKDAWGIMPGATAAYNIHLAKNTTFYWDGSKWVEGTPSTLKAMDSAITQTANAIDAKVSKTYNDGAEKSFGWNISQKEDMPSESEKGSNYHVGDGDGKFVVYSSVKKHADEDAKQTDVLHVNKNGLWVNGNLEVEDDAGQKIFRALPYGDYTEDTDNEEIKYDNKPQVQIGGFTVNKDTLTSNAGVSIGPEGLSVNNSKSGENQFSVLTDGTAWGKKLYIEQDEKHDDDGNVDSYFDGNVCGHQMKVDTVELATTNTDNGSNQTEGFRVEKFNVSAESADANAWKIIFSLGAAYDKRDNTGKYIESDTKTVYCDKTIAAALRIQVTQLDSTISTISISLSGIIKKGNSETTVYLNVTNNMLKSSTDGLTYSEISSVSNIKTISSILNISVISFAPKQEEYFTGDFFAATGFFKDKYGNFTLGMTTDVFSLPWYHEGTLVPTTYIRYSKSDTSTTNKIGFDRYTAYKTLQAGDYCTIHSGKYYKSSGFLINNRKQSDEGYLITTWEYKSNQIINTDKNIKGYLYGKSSEEILPGLSNFTKIEAISMNLIRSEYAVESVDESFADQNIDPFYTYSDEWLPAQYQIQMSNFGVDVTQDKLFEYVYCGQKISLQITSADSNGIIIPCGRYLYSDDKCVLPYPTDMLSFMIYGGNSKISLEDSKTGAVSYSLGIQNSSAYLRTNNLITLKDLSNPTASNISLSKNGFSNNNTFSFNNVNEITNPGIVVFNSKINNVG